MKHNPGPTILRLLTASALALIAVSTQARGDDREGGKRCSVASLKGSYGFYRTGTTAAGPLAAIGLATFDGNGNATVTQSISRNGEIEFDVEFPFLYEVSRDCTGKGFTTDHVETARMVVVDGGDGYYIFSESPGNSVFGVGTKTHKN